MLKTGGVTVGLYISPGRMMMKAGAMASSTSRGSPFSWSVFSWEGAGAGAGVGMLPETLSVMTEAGAGPGEGLAPTEMGGAGVPPALHQDESHQGPCTHPQISHALKQC